MPEKTFAKVNKKPLLIVLFFFEEYIIQNNPKAYKFVSISRSMRIMANLKLTGIIEYRESSKEDRKGSGPNELSAIQLFHAQITC